MPNDFQKIKQVDEVDQFEDGDFLLVERSGVNFKQERSTVFPPPGSVNKNLFFPHNSATNIGTYNTLQTPANVVENFSFEIPKDFVSILLIDLYFIPTISIALVNANLGSHYCNIGEAFNTHTQTNTLINQVHTLNVINKLDVKSVFTSISASDICGLELAWVTALVNNINYLGIHLEYN